VKSLEIALLWGGEKRRTLGHNSKGTDILQRLLLGAKKKQKKTLLIRERPEQFEFFAREASTGDEEPVRKISAKGQTQVKPVTRGMRTGIKRSI